MQQASSMILLLGILLLMPVAVYIITKVRVLGKFGCFFLERDKSLSFKLLKPKGPFIEYKGETYGLNPNRIRIVSYPFGWPALLQQTIKICLYQREDHNPVDINEPLNWVQLKPSPESAIDVRTSLEPRWLRSLAHGTAEGAAAEGKLGRLLPILTLVLAGLTMILCFYLIMKFGGVNSELKDIKEIIKLQG